MNDFLEFTHGEMLWDPEKRRSVQFVGRHPKYQDQLVLISEGNDVFFDDDLFYERRQVAAIHA